MWGWALPWEQTAMVWQTLAARCQGAAALRLASTLALVVGYQGEEALKQAQRLGLWRISR